MKCSPLLLLLFLFAACDYTPYPQGKILYNRYCGACHGEEGEGFRDLYPPVLNSDFFQKDPYQTACYIVHGLEDSIQVNGKHFQQPMLAIGNLNAIEITNILNYIAHSWNPSLPTPLHQDSVKARLKKCQDWPTLN